MGSWKFIILQSALFFVWVFANSFWLLHPYQFDPYPFIALNLLMSAEAAYSTSFVLMSQNRQSARDRIQADHDYEVNIEAENRIEDLQKELFRIEDEKLDIILEELRKLLKGVNIL